MLVNEKKVKMDRKDKRDKKTDLTNKKELVDKKDLTNKKDLVGKKEKDVGTIDSYQVVKQRNELEHKKKNAYIDTSSESDFSEIESDPHSSRASSTSSRTLSILSTTSSDTSSGTSSDTSSDNSDTDSDDSIISPRFHDKQSNHGHMHNTVDDDDMISMTSEEILNTDPLYFVLKKMFVSKNGKNIADILEEISEKLEFVK